MTDSVLVIGAGGFIGRALCTHLSRGARPIQALVRRQPDDPVPGVHYITGGLESAPELDSLLGECACIVYAASSSTPGSSAGKPVDEVDRHLRPLGVLLEKLQTNTHAHLIYLSSAGATYGSSSERPFTEADLLRPASYHGATKVAAEMLITAWANQFGGSASIFRPSNVYGPGQQARAGFGIIPAALLALKHSEPLEIWGDGSATRDYLYIDDLVTLLAKAIDDGGSPGTHTYNASSGENVSVKQLLERISTTAGRPIDLQFTPARAVDASEVRFDSAKARRQFDWQPQYDLATGLKATWEWISKSAG
ncbi:NAD-dependent epimerase/dehydratase family protein [Parahaliea aestuarii]|uniref:NAD-dependent epimerase/dehydratase family protein n=1 Tax=Parahaliea aestuarii TaxID=1852021 RepID=A0A5C9A195_9GAMM|nr:NAD-dependent epimerase/dehydratase family protein [Parahaliea aestuarii]TXS94536.1 NAD-dependent epimerase/dehydratase family protein [Parahaliea aestuarii]